MAVDVFTSPRISFSRDLEELDSRPVLEPIPNRRSDSFLSNPTVDFDFDFCIGRNFTHKISSADEIFANGQILPVEIKRNTHPPEPIHIVSSGNQITKKKKKRLIEFLSDDNEDDEMDLKSRPTNPKSFWQFGRSSSASVENGLPRIRPLTRSKSTGSVANPNKAINNRYYYYNYYYPYITKNISTTSSQRPTLRKTSNGGGVRIDPVLNIIPARAALTLFASFFRANSSKNKRS